jgi:hypothetical protein
VNSYPSTIKVRQGAFHDCVDTEEMYVDWFARLRREKVAPRRLSKMEGTSPIPSPIITYSS